MALIAVVLVILVPALASPPARAQAEPDLFTERLPNGMLALVRERPSSRLVAISVGIRGGSRDEDPLTLGAAHFMEHMYFQGTPRRPNLGDFDRDIEALGGSNNAWTSTESINFHILVPAEGFEVGLDIMADLIVNSTFPADRLEKERQVVIEELNQTLNSPREYVQEIFLKEIFAGHPAENLPGGNRETVGRITRDTLVRFRDTYFVAGNMAVAVVGNVSHDEIFPKLASAFDGLRQAPRPAFKAAPPPAARGRRVAVPYPTQQAQVLLGYPVAGSNSDDRFTLDVLQAVLGGVGQRLYTDVVDQAGLASSVGSAYFEYSDVGVWLAVASTRPDNVDAVVERILGQVRRLRDEPLSADALAEAKSSIAGRAELGQESVVDQAVQLSDGMILGYYQPLDQYVARIQQVSAADVQRVARQYLHPDQALQVVLRPGG